MMNTDKSKEVVIDDTLYDNYYELLKISPYKQGCNKFIRKNMPNVEFLLDKYFEGHKEFTPEFRTHVGTVIDRGLKVISQNGAIPYNYKPMGNSPRILSVNYGQTINNTKKVIRTELYKYLAFANEDYVIIDFDLKSCYMSILLGLYPQPLEQIQAAIESEGGLWKHIEHEFASNNASEHYDKPSVKICVYSAFFQGGSP